MGRGLVRELGLGKGVRERGRGRARDLGCVCQGSRSGFIGGSVTALGSLSSASLLAPTSWGSEKWNSSIMSQLEARGHCAHGIETAPGFSALASLILALSVWHAW